MVCILFVFEDETNLKINLWEYYVNIPPLLLFKLVWTGPTWSNLAPWIIPSICCRAASKSFEASEAEGDKLAMTFWMWTTGANIKKKSSNQGRLQRNQKHWKYTGGWPFFCLHCTVAILTCISSDCLKI